MAAGWRKSSRAMEYLHTQAAKVLSSMVFSERKWENPSGKRTGGVGGPNNTDGETLRRSSTAVERGGSAGRA